MESSVQVMMIHCWARRTVAWGFLALAASAMSQDVAAAGPVARSQVRNGNGAGEIVVLGDSLAVSPSRTGGFPAELQRRLKAAGIDWTVVNAGVKGDKTAAGVRRLGTALTPDARILIIELGANDGLRGMAIAEVEKNLSTIIERAQRQGTRVLLCGMMVPPRYGWQYAIDFPRVFERLAARYDVPLVPFILQGVALNPDLNGPDGIHPNAAGARRIADTVWPFLEPMVRTAAASAPAAPPPAR
jgi:acyl-CoA thioesterase-1